MLTSRISSAVAGRPWRRGDYRTPVHSRAAVAATAQEYVQRDQPDGVPPLALTGERTLPDVPEENYWYRRHLVGLRVDRRALRAASTSSTWPAARATAPTCSPARRPRRPASTPTPRRTSTRGCATPRPTSRFERDLVETYERAVRRRRLPADDRARRRTRGECSSTSSRMLRPGRRRLRLDAEPADARARGRREVGQPVARQGVPRRRSSASSASRHFADVELLGLFHARKLRAPRARDRSSAGTRSTSGSASPSRSTTASRPAISATRLRAARRRAARRARSTSSPSCA